jgi:hypothetical protein
MWADKQTPLRTQAPKQTQFFRTLVNGAGRLRTWVLVTPHPPAPYMGNRARPDRNTRNTGSETARGTKRRADFVCCARKQPDRLESSHLIQLSHANRAQPAPSATPGREIALCQHFCRRRRGGNATSRRIFRVARRRAPPSARWTSAMDDAADLQAIVCRRYKSQTQYPPCLIPVLRGRPQQDRPRVPQRAGGRG